MTSKRLSPIVLPLIVFAFMAFVFVKFCLEQVLPYSTRFEDEGYYLRTALTLLEVAREQGLLFMMKSYLIKDYEALGFDYGPNSNLSFLTSAVFYFLGASRLWALIPNLLALFAVLGASFKYLYAKTQNLWLATFPLAIWLLSSFTYIGAGDLFDFRLDFLGCCLYGLAVLSCLQLLERERPRLRAIAGTLGLVFLAILFRFILLPYFALPLAFVAFVLLKEATGRRELFRRLSVFVAFAVLLALFLWWSWDFLQSYYIEQLHNAEEKAYRLQYFSQMTRLQKIFYYPRIYLEEFTGYWAAGIALGLALFGVVSAKFSGGWRAFLRSRLFLKLTLLALTVLSPWAVLTLNYVRTPQVAGTVFFPLLFLLGELVALSAKRKKVLAGLCALALLAGLFVWPRQIWLLRQAPQRAQISEIEKLHKWMLEYRFRLKEVKADQYVAVLDVLQDIDHNTFTVWAAERNPEKGFFAPEITITRMPFPKTLPKIIQELEASYFFLVPLDWEPLQSHAWPVLHDVYAHRERIQSWLRQNTHEIDRIEWMGRSYLVAVRNGWFH
jgi:hypothetical protein